MSVSNLEQEARIESALDDYYDEIYPSCKKAAEAYGVKVRTLQRRVQGTGSRWTRPATNRTLNLAQEQVLLDYIARLDAIGMSPKPRMLTSSANQILKLAAPSVLRRVGKTWTTRFIARNEGLFTRKTQPLEAARKNTHDPILLQSHFDKFRNECIAKSIVRCDMYNMDETGWRIGIGKGYIVVTMEPRKKLVLTDPDNRDYISSIECISASDDGFALPSYLICAGKWILEKWCIENELDDQTKIDVSESGYSTDDIAMHWLKHFDRHTKKRQHGAWRMLIMDGHGSHMHLDFLNYASKHKIALFVFPSHSTHLLQPLDVGVFQPFKHWHAEEVDKAIRAGQKEFNKLDFFALFPEIKAKTMLPRTISHAWRACGLMPYNPSVVLDKIIEKQAREAERTPPPVPVSPLKRTPHGFKEVIDFAEHLMDIGKKTELPSDFKLALERYVKGSTASAYSRELMEEELDAATGYRSLRAKRQSLPNIIASKHGPVTVGMVRASKRKRDEDEVLKAEAALEAAKIKLKKEQKAALKKRNAPYLSVWKDLKKAYQARNKRLGLKEKDFVVTGIGVVEIA